MIVKRIFQLDWEFCGVLFAGACVFYNGFVLQKSIIFIFSLPINHYLYEDLLSSLTNKVLYLNHLI